MNFFNGDRKLKLRVVHYIENAEKRGNGNSQRSSVCACMFKVKGLTLPLPVPAAETISLQPGKAPDHGYDQAPAQIIQ